MLVYQRVAVYPFSISALEASLTASLLDRCHGLLDISYQLRIVKNAWCSSADRGHNMEKDRGKCCLTFRVYQYMSAYLSIYIYILDIMYIIYIIDVYVCSISILHILQEVLFIWIFGGTAWNLAMATTKAQDQVQGGLLGGAANPKDDPKAPYGWLISSQKRMEKGWK